MLRLALATSLALAGSAGSVLAAPSAPKPVKTIILVHGAFADGSSWDGVAPILQSKGYNVVAVHEPLSGLADDVAATQRVIEAQPGPVLLVGHSWGGVVITEAGNSDKVAGLVYVAAFAPDAGESVADLGKGSPPPPWAAKVIVDSAGFLTLPAETVTKDFAQDVSPATAKLITYKQGPILNKAFADKVKTAAWKAKPSWYVRADEDHMIDPNAQAAMAKRANAKVTNLHASHVPMVSKPAEVANAILDAAAGKR